jgi:hypothetical protein
MRSVETAMRYLEHLQRNDLSGLLVYSTYVLEDQKGFGRGPDRQTLVIYSPKPYSDALKAIPDYDRKRIPEAILTGEHSIAWGQPPIEDYSSESIMERPREGTDALLAELIINQQAMISVATGGERIQEVNDYFVAREARIRPTTSLTRMGQISFALRISLHRFQVLSSGKFGGRGCLVLQCS